MKAINWLFIFMMLCACGSDGTGALPLAAPGTGLRAIQDRGKIVVGVKNDVRIFGYLNPTTNQVEGFDVDMAKAIAKYVFGDETKIELKEAVSKNRIPFLDDGTVDVVISTMTINEARVLQVDFAETYYVAGQSLLVPKGSAIRSIADVAGKKIGTVKGSTSDTSVNTDVTSLDTISAAVAALAAGQVDVVINDDIILLGFVKDSPDKWEVVGGQLTAEPYGIAVKKGNAELLAAINSLVPAMKKDGRWKAIYEKWVSSPAPAPPPADWHAVKAASAQCPADDSCVALGPIDAIRLATLLDNTTTLAAGGLAISTSFGIDDRRGAEVARLLRSSSLGHTVNFAGPDLLAGLPNYRENCNNLDPSLPQNQAGAAAIAADGTILGVIGPVCSNSGFHIEPTLTTARVLVVSPNNQAPSLTATCPDPQTTPATLCRPAGSYYFRTAANGKFGAGVMAAQANQAGYKSAATIDDGSAYSHGLSDSFAAAFTGGTTVNRSPVTTAEQMDAALAAIKAAGAPDFIYITSTSVAQTRTLITKARATLPAATVYAVTNAAGQIRDFWDLPSGIGTAADGVLVSVIDRAFTTSNQYTTAFLPKYQTLSSGAAPPNNFHGFSFDAYNIILDAIEKVAIKDDGRAKGALLIPRKALRAALIQTNKAGLTTVGSATLNCSAGDAGDCGAGAAAFKIDSIACPPPTGGGTCNFVANPLP